MGVSRIFAVVLVVGLFSAMVPAQEKRIRRSDLPAQVEKTVAAQSQGANTTIRSFSEEKENGQTHYEVELVVDGHSKGIEMDGDGAVIEVEEQVAMDAVPVVLEEGLRKNLGTGRLLRVESIRKHDKIVAYEAQITTHGKKSEVQVDPSGKPLDHKE